MRFEPLPHAFPFRFVDRVVERTGAESGRVRAVVSAGGRGASGGHLAGPLVGELMAQSALLLSGTDPELGRTGFLAGLSDVSVERAPVPGDALTVDVAITGRLGAVVKFEASVHDAGGARIAGGTFTVRRGDAATETRP